MPLPFFHLLSYLAPKQLQAYHDAVIEPLTDPTHASIVGLAKLPTVVTGLGALFLDAVSAVGFAAYTCASVQGLTAVAAAGLAARAARGKAK